MSAFPPLSGDEQTSGEPAKMTAHDPLRTNRALHVIVPGTKQRTLTPIGPYSGQTSVTLALFGSSMTASSGTQTHSVSTLAAPVIARWKPPGVVGTRTR